MNPKSITYPSFGRSDDNSAANTSGSNVIVGVHILLYKSTETPSPHHNRHNRRVSSWRTWRFWNGVDDVSSYRLLVCHIPPRSAVALDQPTTPSPPSWKSAEAEIRVWSTGWLRVPWYMRIQTFGARPLNRYPINHHGGGTDRSLCGPPTIVFYRSVAVRPCQTSHTRPCAAHTMHIRAHSYILLYLSGACAPVPITDVSSSRDTTAWMDF